MAKIKLGKLDAASRQLATAIELWFNDSDPVAIQTLACSAYQIVHDINKKARGRDLLYDSLVVKDEYRKVWINIIKAPCNFFKHADKDANDTVDFDPSTNEIFMIFSCLGLDSLGIKPNIARAAFILYQMLSRPEILTEKGSADLEKYPDSLKQKALTMAKPDFYKIYHTYHSSLGRQ